MTHKEESMYKQAAYTLYTAQKKDIASKHKQNMHDMTQNVDSIDKNTNKTFFVTHKQIMWILARKRFTIWPRKSIMWELPVICLCER